MRVAFAKRSSVRVEGNTLPLSSRATTACVVPIAFATSSCVMSAFPLASLDAFPLDIRASFQRISELIQSHGLERVREPYVKHLEGPLWEMRMKGRSGIARACYVTAVGKRVVVVHVFEKKTQKTPRREILTALKRAKEVQ